MRVVGGVGEGGRWAQERTVRGSVGEVVSIGGRGAKEAGPWAIEARGEGVGETVVGRGAPMRAIEGRVGPMWGSIEEGMVGTGRAERTTRRSGV